MTPPLIPFDPETFMHRRLDGHSGKLKMAYRAHGADWSELALPYAAELIGDPRHGVIASGPVIALLDVATSVAVWLRRGGFLAHATLDLRVDYLRPATPGATIIGRGECYRVTRSIAFVRGAAHDGEPGDPIAHVAGTFMVTGASA